MEVVAEWGKPLEQQEIIALIYQNKTIGQLVVAPRGTNEHFTTVERTLLMTIAALTATTVRAVQLSDELRQSRQRIVTAREEERRRIRRDLHDGLGPQLASQTLGLDAIAQLMETNPQKAHSLLESLQAQAHESIQDVRRLIYDLRPPALDDLGLFETLKQSTVRYETGQLHFSFELSDMRSVLPAAIETAIYRITQEAITNVVRHAQATRCTVRLSCTDNEILVKVEDNGRGLPTTYQPGIGLQTMRERAAELNGETIIDVSPQGGTRVLTRLPLEQYPA
jgi:signal transduction histidine kinase